MNEYIREFAAQFPQCVVIVLPDGLEIDPIDGITFERHALELVEYRDADGVVLARHTVIA